jgi:microcystin-dependent protein
MTLYKCSQTASSDATADPTINWAEGQAPSSVNDSARAMMAATAKYRDDISGAIVTGGTSTAYTVTSYEVFDTLAHLAGQMVAFTPHTTNGATVTLNVDSLGAKPLRSAPGVELLAGTVVQGTPYVAVYNNGDGAFYLQGFYVNPYNVPLLGGIDFWDTIAPNSSFIFPAGQAISRATYAAAFARWGTTYGAGDGSTTFNVPDKTERVSVMKAAAASRLTATYFGGNSTVMGATGGSESHTLTAAEIPAHSHGVNDPGHTHTLTNGSYVTKPYVSGSDFNGGSAFGFSAASVNNATTGITIQNNTGGGAHAIVQPTIVCNYIIRII